MQDTTTVACEPAAGGENTVLKDPRQNQGGRPRPTAAEGAHAS
jgi:hypothetical protein